MKTKLAVHCGATLLLSTLNPQLSTFAQGSLTPPGAPAPTMKTLAQIEPRTPISSVPFTISVPGSYYLTTNVTTTVSNAIVITVSGVTLDLSGFTISSTVASAANGGYAILLPGGLSDITILNGHIRGGVTNNGSGVYSGSGFAGGIFNSGLVLANARISGISVSGCSSVGIYLNNGDSTVIEACTARTIGNIGILGSIINNSVAVDCASYGIYGDQVSNCRATVTGGGYGLYASSSAVNCYGQSSGTYGLFASSAQN